MLLNKFKKVLCNHISVARTNYLYPYKTDGDGYEWLILERFGDNGEFLTISDTNVKSSCKNISQTPNDLKADKTMLCVLVEETEKECRFLMVRRNDYQLNVDGNYFPADGYALVSLKQGKLVLHAGGRHIHDLNGSDVPYQYFPNKGSSWIFDAKEI